MTQADADRYMEQHQDAIRGLTNTQRRILIRALAEKEWRLHLWPQTVLRLVDLRRRQQEDCP